MRTHATAAPARLAHAAMRTCLRAACAISAVAISAVCATGLRAQQQPPPPEYGELKAAEGMADVQARIAEIRRIKAAHPNSRIIRTIDTSLLEALCEGSATFGELTGHLAAAIDGEKDQGQVMHLSAFACHFLVSNPRSGDFPKADLLRAVAGHRERAAKLLAEPKTLAAIPADHRGSVVSSHRAVLETSMAKAQLLCGDPKAAARTLEEYGRDGERNAQFYRLLGDARLGQKRDADALDAYFSAFVEGDGGALGPARDLYRKLNGGDDGFDGAMERRMARLPYRPDEFREPKEWKGKAVLLELFTGSECPPCVGADFGVDGLIESYPSRYLAVLEYHLPIPRPDPMMNPGTKRRQDYYEIKSTPSVVIDGARLAPGGGARRDAEPLYRQYKGEIDARLGQEPVVGIQASASLEGGKVVAACEFSKVPDGAQFFAALAQEEEKHMGVNGIIFHKMVVKACIPLPMVDKKISVSFDLADIERRIDDYLTEFEGTNTRFKDFKFPVRLGRIDGRRLKLVLFAQDSNTKQVYNAFVADVAAAG